MVKKKQAGQNKPVNMEMVENLRHSYKQVGLRKHTMAEDPFRQFNSWFQEALEARLPDANAMTLATASASGRPSARIVLLKGFDEEGFRFYTNYKSRKARELSENPRASLCFLWSQLERQVRIEGEARKLSREKSADYFKKRPRDSQLGAWASQQSSEIASREQLEENLNKIEQRFAESPVPLPDFWGGYVLKPIRAEFWQGRPGRLHDRLVYFRQDDDWQLSRLAP